MTSSSPDYWLGITTTMKNTIYIYVKDTVIRMYENDQLHPPYGFRFFNIFSKIYSFCRPGNQSNSAIWTKAI